MIERANVCVSGKGLMFEGASIMGPTMIAAPSSTKSNVGERIPRRASLDDQKLSVGLWLSVARRDRNVIM